MSLIVCTYVLWVSFMGSCRGRGEHKLLAVDSRLPQESTISGFVGLSGDTLMTHKPLKSPPPMELNVGCGSHQGFAHQQNMTRTFQT